MVGTGSTPTASITTERLLDVEADRKRVTVTGLEDTDSSNTAVTTEGRKEIGKEAVVCIVLATSSTGN